MNNMYISWAEYKDKIFYIKRKHNDKWYEVEELLHQIREYVKQLDMQDLRTQNIREYHDILKVCTVFWYSIVKDDRFIY